MRTLVRLPVAFILWSALLVSGHDAQQSPAPKPSFTLAISLAQEVVKVGSSVALTIVLANTSDRKIQVVEEASGCLVDYDVDVWDSQGKAVRRAEPKITKDKNGRTVRRVFIGASSVTNVDLLPGGKVTGLLPADKVFDLAQPGRYSIQASRYDGQTKAWVKSNTITFTVTP